MNTAYTKTESLRKRVAELDAEIVRLHIELGKWKEYHEAVMCEPCGIDKLQKHCTCVPALRKRIAELEVDLEIARGCKERE
jgi:hypothetical protein